MERAEIGPQKDRRFLKNRIRKPTRTCLPDWKVVGYSGVLGASSVSGFGSEMRISAAAQASALVTPRIADSVDRTWTAHASGRDRTRRAAPGYKDAVGGERPEHLGKRRIVSSPRSCASLRSWQFTLPKNGQVREASLTDPAREALVALPVEGEFCFAPIRGDHWTASARAYHWKAVRAAAGWEGSLYLATRHSAGWYMVNLLDVPSEDMAIALGHTDGGELVRRLYGHRDHDRALDRVAAAYERTRASLRCGWGWTLQCHPRTGVG
jgi:hypothetical protein